MRVLVTFIVAAVGAGIAACPGGDGESPLGPAVEAPRLDRPELVVWRSSQLVRVRADGRTVQVLVGDPSGEGFVATQWEPAGWSPDGRRLAFTAQVAGVLADTNIYVMRSDGSGRRRLTSDGISFHPVWSPDGKRIYFARRPERHPEQITLSDGSLEVPQWIWSMRPDGSDKRAVTEPVKGRYELPGSFAPDGTLAYTRGTYVELDEEGRERNTREVWTMRPDGSDARKLAERAQDPAFSSDGRRIAFASDRDANGSLNYGDKSFFANELYVMNADGGQPRRLTRTRDVNELQPSWLPGGARIAYQRGWQYQNAQITTVMQANPDGSCPRPVLAGRPRGRWYGAPVWRPGDARRGDHALRC
jgi:Tol biopolymer transport system component